MSTFELTGTAKETSGLAPLAAVGGFDSSVLLNNSRWFIRIRWLVVACLFSAGMLGVLVPQTFGELGLNPPGRWPWLLGFILASGNAGFHMLNRELTARSSRLSIEINLWLQIVLDLLVLTMLVHFIGSTCTFIAFMYLFHIVLACIFFPPTSSLMVTVMATVMYLFCVVIETSGILPVRCILTHPLSLYSQSPAILQGIMAVSATCIWFIIWYLVSTLSGFVRERDIRMNILNSELVKADLEKNKLMLQTTHDLKAPFSGIENNIQILRLQHWDEMPEPIRKIVERIEVRSETLRERIRDILLLGDLRSQADPNPVKGTANLQHVINAVLDDLIDKAKERNVTVSVEIPSLQVHISERHLKILFLNLISNAILYSQPGGTVEISTEQDADRLSVSITDHGIGIKAEALPRIFDDYFRTREAADFNKMSTGLGLAIVRQIANNFNLRIRVTSVENQGTKFVVTI